jgi:cytochrome oxidase Cu insertion factor (SCO1/SenC/PrrC family)
MPALNRGASLGACALVLALSAAPVVFAQSDAASKPPPADATAQAISTPRYLLMAPNGRSVTSEDFRGRLQLISFGFTSCPDVCPTTLLEMTHVLTALGAKAQYIQPIFITVDPQRDTAQVLGAYTAAFDARILGLTGPPALVQRAAANFKVQFEKIQEPGAEPRRLHHGPLGRHVSARPRRQPGGQVWLRRTGGRDHHAHPVLADRGG